MESALKQLAADMRGKAVVGIISQTERELFRAFSITGIPAFFVIYDGEVKQSYRGFQEKQVLADALRRYGS